MDICSMNFDLIVYRARNTAERNEQDKANAEEK